MGQSQPKPFQHSQVCSLGHIQLVPAVVLPASPGPQHCELWETDAGALAMAARFFFNSTKEFVRTKMRCVQDEIEVWSQEGNPYAQISFSKHSRYCSCITSYLPAAIEAGTSSWVNYDRTLHLFQSQDPLVTDPLVWRCLSGFYVQLCKNYASLLNIRCLFSFHLYCCCNVWRFFSLVLQTASCSLGKPQAWRCTG